MQNDNEGEEREEAKNKKVLGEQDRVEIKNAKGNEVSTPVDT